MLIIYFDSNQTLVILNDCLYKLRKQMFEVIKKEQVLRKAVVGILILELVQSGSHTLHSAISFRWQDVDYSLGTTKAASLLHSKSFQKAHLCLFEVTSNTALCTPVLCDSKQM